MQKTENDTSLVWFRNDLRVSDNTSLSKALCQHENTIAVYCFDPRHFKTTSYGFKKTAQYRAKFLIESITDLKQNLDALNIPLFVFQEKPEIVIPKLCIDYNVNTVYLQKEWTEEENNVSNSVKQHTAKTVHFKTTYAQFLYHPDDIKLPLAKIPQVFTNFRKHVEKEVKVRPLISCNTKSKQQLTNTTKIPSLQDLDYKDFKTPANSAFPFKGGETKALERLDDYFFKTKKIGVYKKTRNGLIGKDFSSKFSAWLANGSISAKTIYWKLKAFEEEHYKNQSTYWLIFELIWRDYFKYIALKHGNNIFKIGGILNKSYQWDNTTSQIEKWINGKTNSDFVNANMIELKKTGWMSNRGRQNVASYFAKDLCLDWRIGAAYFEALLIDYDVHSNYGNWMYVSGVGNDPRDRKFNVKLQAERYDPNGKFQNLWLQPSLF
jgi:deoxyribodipyrimidine photo-lyase